MEEQEWDETTDWVMAETDTEDRCFRLMSKIVSRLEYLRNKELAGLFHKN